MTILDRILRIDEKLFFAVNNGWGSPLTDGLMTLASVAGDFAVLFSFGLLYIILWGGEQKVARLLAFIAAMFIAGAGLNLAKEYFDRDRPLKFFSAKIEKGAVYIRAPHNKLHKRSFPSGHSQAAFSAATFFALYYRRYRLLLFSMASMVAISRVFLGAHYPADVMAGSMFGMAMVWLVWRFDPMSARQRKRLDDSQGSV